MEVYEVFTLVIQNILHKLQNSKSKNENKSKDVQNKEKNNYKQSVVAPDLFYIKQNTYGTVKRVGTIPKGKARVGIL